jgi:hypothetical protein
VLAVAALKKGALIWVDAVDTSAFQSCVVVDLWQSVSEWHLRVDDVSYMTTNFIY